VPWLKPAAEVLTNADNEPVATMRQLDWSGWPTVIRHARGTMCYLMSTGLLSVDAVVSRKMTHCFIPMMTSRVLLQQVQ